MKINKQYQRKGTHSSDRLSRMPAFEQSFTPVNFQNSFYYMNSLPLKPIITYVRQNYQ